MEKMSNYERMLWHRALWIWCAETGEFKSEWPGWKIFPKLKYNKIRIVNCFLCPDSRTCEDCHSIGWGAFSECLQGLWKGALGKLRCLSKNPNSWIARRAYQLACYRVAFVPIKDAKHDFNEYMTVMRKLDGIEGHGASRVVPCDEADYKRFKKRIKEQANG